MTEDFHFPAIEGCPECGHKRLAAIENVRKGTTITLDGSGGIAQTTTGNLIEVTYSFLECQNCEETLAIDGEIVHDDIE